MNSANTCFLIRPMDIRIKHIHYNAQYVFRYACVLCFISSIYTTSYILPSYVVRTCDNICFASYGTDRDENSRTLYINNIMTSVSNLEYFFTEVY